MRPVAVAATVALRVANFPDLGLEGSFLIGGALTVVDVHVWHLGYWTAPVAMLSGAAMGTATAFLYLLLRLHLLRRNIHADDGQEPSGPCSSGRMRACRMGLFIPPTMSGLSSRWRPDRCFCCCSSQAARASPSR